MPDVLVINRLLLSRVPYRAWLGNDVRLRMITNKPVLGADQGHDLDSLHVVNDYDSSGRVEELASILYQEQPYGNIIALSEYDILRAARLRDFLGVPGQTYQSALAFRDKVVMKDYWAAAGLPVTPYAALHTATDLLEFSERQGFPVVVKPRRGAGFRSVAVLRDSQEQGAWLEHVWSLSLSDISSWMVEKFVEGEMLHVDGIIRSGYLEIAWPSVITSLLAFHERDPTVSLMLDADDPAVDSIKAIIAAALRVLPTPELAILHAEIWRKSDNTLVLNEVASRLGGGKIRPTIRAAFGTDMLERFVQGSVFPDRLAEQVPPLRPERAAGFVLIPPGSGTIASVPDVPARFRDEAYAEATITAHPGQEFTGAVSSIDSIAACVATGESRSEVAKLLESFIEWSNSAISYQY